MVEGWENARRTVEGLTDDGLEQIASRTYRQLRRWALVAVAAFLAAVWADWRWATLLLPLAWPVGIRAAILRLVDDERTRRRGHG